jgi:hypothetical protein
VNPKDAALLARYDHVVSKCAHFVERNPDVVRCDAPIEERKRRDGICTTTNIDLKDGSAFGDEKVARGEPGIHGLGWSESHVFFPAGTKPRNLREQRGSPVAADRYDVFIAVWGNEQKILRHGHARGKEVAGKSGV